MHPMLNIAIRAARKAGNHIAKSLENADKIETSLKGTNDLVTNVDKEAEYLIIETIKLLILITASLQKSLAFNKVKTTLYNG
ncbi:inositol-1-monophosphatase [Vibrio sp. JCM 19236]|nr:inositol-1-monophosphatase [Vibrio sp. JCM 19236]